MYAINDSSSIPTPLVRPNDIMKNKFANKANNINNFKIKDEKCLCIRKPNNTRKYTSLVRSSYSKFSIPLNNASPIQYSKFERSLKIGDEISRAPIHHPLAPYYSMQLHKTVKENIKSPFRSILIHSIITSTDSTHKHTYTQYD